MRTLPLLLGLLTANLALAGPCEDNFVTRGDPRNGAEFSTSAMVAGTSADSALGQLRSIAKADGFKVLSEDNGVLEIEQSRGVKYPFLIHLSARNKGKGSEISIRTKLNKGVTAKPEDMRGGMCGMIARLKPGTEGEAIAAKARQDDAQSGPIKVKAITLARELDSAARKQGPEIVSARYKGKVYQLDGEIREPFENEGTLEIWYDVFREGNWLMPAEAGSSISRTQVICRLAKDQVAEGRLLKPGDMARLTGKVVHFREGTPRRLTLEGCKFSH